MDAKKGSRRFYAACCWVNGRQINEIAIDPHYEEKHPDIHDELILNLVSVLNGNHYQAEERHEDWEFFSLDRIEYREKRYRLVWCMRDECNFIGVINCFRR